MLACRYIQALALITTIAATPSLAIVVRTVTAEDEASTFPKPAIIRKQIRFWEKVFYKYPSTTVIVHEAQDPNRLVDLIDYTIIGSRKPDEPVPRHERDALTKRYLKRYNQALEHFQQYGEGAVKFGAIEKRVWNVYQNSPAALRKLLKGDIKLRAQTGLADEFRRAASIAVAYLPYMERVFSQYGLPTRLTRLPFVESMFNMRARSKVGASGIWQFMPATAKLFIYVNHLVDERNSPYKATRAAAQLMALNYRELGNWPLAITAYNHGTLGMQRAARQVGTDDLGEIIKHYQSPSFGFASRNFYAEFLAAANSFERLQRSGKLTKTETLPEVESVILEKPISINELIAHTPINRDMLNQLNPCILNSTLTTHSDQPLPAFYEIKVPRNLLQATRAALIELKNKRYARR